MFGSRRARPLQPPGTAVRQLSGCGGIALGLFFSAFSLVFVVVAAHTAFNDWWQSRYWERVEAQLVSVEITLPPELQAEAVEEGDGWAFHLKVRYRYEFGGRSFTSSRWRRDAGGSDEYEPLSKAGVRLKAARPLYCLVNPERPDEAILERRTEGLPMVVWGLLFFLAGIGMIVVFRRVLHITDATTTMEQASPRGSLLLGGAFVSIFLAVGLFFGWLGISALKVENRAGTWPEVPCEIVRTGWSNESGGVLYRYSVNGEIHHSDRVRPAGGMNTGSSFRWKTGRHATCRVDPSDPRSAVLLTESKGWLTILFSVPFIAFGLFGWGAVIHRWRKARRT